MYILSHHGRGVSCKGHVCIVTLDLYMAHHAHGTQYIHNLIIPKELYLILLLSVLRL